MTPGEASPLPPPEPIRNGTGGCPPPDFAILGGTTRPLHTPPDPDITLKTTQPLSRPLHLTIQTDHPLGCLDDLAFSFWTTLGSPLDLYIRLRATPPLLPPETYWPSGTDPARRQTSGYLCKSCRTRSMRRSLYRTCLIYRSTTPSPRRRRPLTTTPTPPPPPTTPTT